MNWLSKKWRYAYLAQLIAFPLLGFLALVHWLWGSVPSWLGWTVLTVYLAAGAVLTGLSCYYALEELFEEL